MMRKLTSKSGMTLMETLASLLILVLLVVGMNTGMSTGIKVYQDAQLETRRTMLASNLNTKMADILRYSHVIDYEDGHPLDYVITNLEYGLLNANFLCEPTDNGILHIYFWDNTGKTQENKRPLISTNSYENLRISDFCCNYNPDGYFDIYYNLLAPGETASTNLSREDPTFFQTVVRIMNK